MNKTDTLGYNFEMSNIECLKGNGYGKYIRFANPSNTWAWKRKREIGVDMVLGLGEDTYYIEESYCSYRYNLSQSWFDACRLPRFRDYPSDINHHHIILTNMPENFAGVNVGVVLVVTITWLLSLLGDYHPSLDRTIPIIQMPMERVVDDRQLIDHPSHEEWLQEQLDRAVKYSG